MLLCYFPPSQICDIHKSSACFQFFAVHFRLNFWSLQSSCLQNIEKAVFTKSKLFGYWTNIENMKNCSFSTSVHSVHQLRHPINSHLSVQWTCFVQLIIKVYFWLYPIFWEPENYDTVNNANVPDNWVAFRFSFQTPCSLECLSMQSNWWKNKIQLC